MNNIEAEAHVVSKKKNTMEHPLIKNKQKTKTKNKNTQRKQDLHCIELKFTPAAVKKWLNSQPLSHHFFPFVFTPPPGPGLSFLFK